MKEIIQNRIFLIGLGILVIGSGPLLFVIAAAKLGFTADPNPNPIIFGMSAGVTFWPAIILMAIGAYRAKKDSKTGSE